jgi:hypothetical protein
MQRNGRVRVLAVRRSSQPPILAPRSPPRTSPERFGPSRPGEVHLGAPTRRRGACEAEGRVSLSWPVSFIDEARALSTDCGALLRAYHRTGRCIKKNSPKSPRPPHQERIESRGVWFGLGAERLRLRALSRWMMQSIEELLETVRQTQIEIQFCFEFLSQRCRSTDREVL